MLKWFAGVAMTATVLFSMNTAMALDYDYVVSCDGPAPQKIEGGYIYTIDPKIEGPCPTDKSHSSVGRSQRMEHATKEYDRLPSGTYVFTATYEFDKYPFATRVALFQLHNYNIRKAPPVMLQLNSHGCLSAHGDKMRNVKKDCEKMKKFDIIVAWKTGENGYVKMFQNEQLFYERNSFDKYNTERVYAKWGMYSTGLARPVSVAITNVNIQRIE